MSALTWVLLLTVSGRPDPIALSAINRQHCQAQLDIVKAHPQFVSAICLPEFSFFSESELKLMKFGGGK